MIPFKIIGMGIIFLFLQIIYVIIVIPTLILFFISKFLTGIIFFIESILVFLQENVFGNLNAYKNKLYKKIIKIIHNADEEQK